jgi:predicted  nucleic acid-binding Zn-ribbon protein
MLEKIKREITYIRARQYGFRTAITIDGKEYLENEIYADGKYTVYPESLEDQLQRLIPDIDVELIEELVDDAKNAVTPDDIKSVQDTWDALVRIDELMEKVSKDDTNKADKMYRTLVRAYEKILDSGKNICKEHLKGSSCGKCPFRRENKCMFKPTITALASLRDACGK